MKACSVIGAPDADLGEVPVAFVVIQHGHRFDENSLKGEVEQRLSRVHVPARVVGVDVLPENAIGKVDRESVRPWPACR